VYQFISRNHAALQDIPKEEEISSQACFGLVVESVQDSRVYETITQNQTGKDEQSQAQSRVVRVFARRFKQGAIEKTEENPALVLSHNTARDAILLRKSPENCTRCRNVEQKRSALASYLSAMSGTLFCPLMRHP
jgi:hypothetical protein